MKKNRVIHCLVLVIVGSAFLRHAHCAWDDHIWLKVQGKHIVTSDSANPPNEIFCPIGTALERDFNYRAEGRMEKFAEFVKAHGLNTVRFAFRATNYKESDAEYNFDSTLAIMLDWLDIAREHGIYTIFDNHEYLGHSSVSYTSEAMFAFWENNFRKLADSVKVNPWVIGFEVMNEIYTSVMTKDQIRARILSCAAKIREVDSRHILFLPLHDENLSAYDVLDPPQVVATPHAYPTNVRPVVSWANERDTHNNPFLTTEFGGGFMANGFTHDHDKAWLKEFMRDLDDHALGWMIWIYRQTPQTNNASEDYFPTVYGPDDPQIWIPVAKSMSEQYPVANDGTPRRIEFDRLPLWLPNGLAINEEYELTLRIVDTTGSLLKNSNASVSVSVSGPAALSNQPANFTNGKAAVTLTAGETPGSIVVSAVSAQTGVSGRLELTSADIWTGFQMRKLDGTWVNEGTATDNFSPECRVNIGHPGKGIALHTARYEYSNDGGETWVYWDDSESDTFDGAGLNATRWTAADHNSTDGSAAVADGKLTIRAEGEDVWSEWNTDNWWCERTYGKDEFFYVHEERTGDFEIVTKITSQDNTDPMALAGILVRDDLDDDRYNGYCYVAATPDSGYVFGWKYLGLTNNGNRDKVNEFRFIDSRAFAGSVTYPCYLKLSKVMHPSYYTGSETGWNRQFQIYSAWYSTDGANWTKITSKVVHQAHETQRVGLFACSGNDGVYGEAVFDFYRVAARAVLEDQSVTARYSSGPERFVSAAIPFLQASNKRQEVRFKVNTLPPWNDYNNHAGEVLVSPRYAVFDGEHVGTATERIENVPVAMKIVPGGGGGGVLLRYQLPDNRVTSLKFSVYDLAGRRLWHTIVERPAQSGTVVYRNAGGNNVPAGTRVVYMEAGGPQSKHGPMIIKKLVTYLGQ